MTDETQPGETQPGEIQPEEIEIDKPVVFVLGTGRCGSTVVEEILARHEAMAFVSNIEDRVGVLDGRNRLNRAIYRRVSPAMTKKGRLRFAPSEAYDSIAREVSPSLVQPAADLTAADLTPWLRRRLRSWVATRSASQDGDVFLHKFTGWPRIGLLAAAFPEARFLHIVRDGRAVANSWLQMDWWLGHHGPAGWHFGPLPARYQAEWDDAGRPQPLLAGLAWKLLLDAFDTCIPRLPSDRYLELRFEDVVQNPEDRFAAMLDFMGIDHNPDFAAAIERTGLTTGRLRAFETDLGPAHVEALTTSLRTHLLARGYAL